MLASFCCADASFASAFMYYIFGSGTTLYSEAFVLDFNAPNGLFYQSPLVTYIVP